MSLLRFDAPSGSRCFSQSRVSRVVAELESRGLVARSGDPEDSRAVLVAILDDGVELFKIAHDPHLDDLDELLFSRLSDEEIYQLGAICEKVLGRSVIGKAADPAQGDAVLPHHESSG